MKKSLYHYFMYWAEKTPDRIAIVDDTGSITYRDLVHGVKSVASMLQALGVVPGDRVLIGSDNCTEYIILLGGILRIGATVASVNIQYRWKELKNAFGTLQPKVAFFKADEQRHMAEAFGLSTPILPLDKRTLLCTAPLDKEYRAPNGAVIVLTSGSSGKPKAALTEEKSLLLAAQNIAQRFRITSEDICYVPVPMCHMFGLMGTLVHLSTGGTLITSSRFTPWNALKLLEQYKVSVQYCVPTMYAREIDTYEQCKEQPNLSALRTGMIAGAPSVRTYMEWFEDHLGCRLLNAYGMTEANTLAVADFEDTRENRMQKIGRPCSGVDLRIMGSNGEILTAGSPGEVVCRGPVLFKGYWEGPEHLVGNPAKTGWFRTGDIGKLDTEGYLSILGRKKDIILRGGYNVVPGEIEAMLLQNPKIAEACVVGCPDEALGEQICAFVCLQPGGYLSCEELHRFAQESISHYKVPDHFVQLPKLPKLPNEKVDRLKLEHIAKSAFSQSCNSAMQKCINLTDLME